MDAVAGLANMAKIHRNNKSGGPLTTLSNKFWRLDPAASVDPAAFLDDPGLSSPSELVAKVGRLDGIVVASWDPDAAEGRVHALGVVQDKRDGSASVDWRRANFTLRPSPQGRAKWVTMPYFKFDDLVADRYRLREYFAEALASSESDHAIARPETAAGTIPQTMPTAPVASPAEARPAPEPMPTRSPQCNRVGPNGEIFADHVRGTFMGNRTSAPRWLICDLHFKRDLKEPRKYTKLFFLDEAVALAAGHRPCKTCRGERYRAFLHAVAAEIPVAGAPELDARLQASRNGNYERRSINALPDGAFVEDDAGNFWLKWAGGLHRWTPGGYVDATAITTLGITEAAVLTPATSLVALRNGYIPAVHPSVTAEQ